jgi:hypothetical protein
MAGGRHREAIIVGSVDGLRLRLHGLVVALAHLLQLLSYFRIYYSAY